MPDTTMLIGEVAERLDINPKTIRYYERIGLIPEPARNESRYRIYTATDVERLGFILRAKALDFSLDEISEILDVREREEAPCPYVVSQIETKIEQIDDKIADLRRLRRELKSLRELVTVLGIDVVEAKGDICHLIENDD